MMRSNCRAVKSLSFFHTYCSIFGRSIIRRSIKCRVYVLTYLLSVASLFCLSMFCRTTLDLACPAKITAWVQIPPEAEFFPAYLTKKVSLSSLLFSSVISDFRLLSFENHRLI